MKTQDQQTSSRFSIVWKTLAALALCAVLSVSLTSCNTATGQGAGIGAASGAIIGGMTGSGQNAAFGAGAGAIAGGLIGAIVDANNAAPATSYPYGRFAGHRGFVISPYQPHYEIDTRGIPHGALVRDPSNGRIFVKP